MSSEPKPEVGKSYVMLSTMTNPFDKKFARVMAVQSGFVQFKSGTAPDFMRGKPRSTTLARFMETYGPL